MTVTTDRNGYFTLGPLCSLAPGSYTLTATAPGYTPVTQTVYMSPQAQPFEIYFTGPYCLPPVILPVTGGSAPGQESVLQSVYEAATSGRHSPPRTFAGWLRLLLRP